MAGRSGLGYRMGYRMGYIRALMGYRIVLSFLKASGVSQDCWEAHGTEVFEPLGALVAQARPHPSPARPRPGPARPGLKKPGPTPSPPDPEPTPTRPEV